MFNSSNTEYVYIWKLNISLKVKILVWLIILTRLHKAGMTEKGVITHGLLCGFCSASSETHNHHFFIGSLCQFYLENFLV